MLNKVVFLFFMRVVERFHYAKDKTSFGFMSLLCCGRFIPNRGAVLSADHRYTFRPTPATQVSCTCVWRGRLSSSLIIGQMPVATPQERANYQSRPLHSQQEMTSWLHVICGACQRRSALHRVKHKQQLESRGRDALQWNLSRQTTRI